MREGAVVSGVDPAKIFGVGWGEGAGEFRKKIMHVDGPHACLKQLS